MSSYSCEIRHFIDAEIKSDFVTALTFDHLPDEEHFISTKTASPVKQTMTSANYELVSGREYAGQVTVLICARSLMRPDSRQTALACRFSHGDRHVELGQRAQPISSMWSLAHMRRFFIPRVICRCCTYICLHVLSCEHQCESVCAGMKNRHSRKNF